MFANTFSLWWHHRLVSLWKMPLHTCERRVKITDIIMKVCLISWPPKRMSETFRSPWTVLCVSLIRIYWNKKGTHGLRRTAMRNRRVLKSWCCGSWTNKFLCRVELGGGQHYFSKIIWFDYFVPFILELSKL